MSDIEQRLRDAMDGVTPGPWYQTGEPWFSAGDGVLAGSPDGNIAYLIADCDNLALPRDEYDGPFQLGDQDRDAAYIALCSPDNIGALLDTIASLRSKLEEAERALEPFALVAEYDIGDSESDEDIFRPMDGRNSIAGLVRVGHLRAARRTLASLREADHG